MRGLLGGATTALAVAVAASFAAPAASAIPIPQGPLSGGLQKFIGAPATPRPVRSPDPPRHPFMAPNGRSNLHDDAYQTDTYQTPGPLGNGITTLSSAQLGECGSVTFDPAGRIVTVCVGLLRPTLELLDPRTMDSLASYSLPPRDPQAGNPFTSFGGGGYFYLDQNGRAVIPTTSHHIFVIRETAGPGFALQRDYDVSSAVGSGDSIISALPDWSGRLWFVSAKGVVGTVDPTTGALQFKKLGEPIGNSFAVDETGGVYIVSDAAMYRFDADATGFPQVSWRERYANIGVAKPGQTEKGSGTTPTLMGGGLVSITDNADPMDVVVFRRAKRIRSRRRVCTVPVFDKGASDTDQSLIGTARSMIVENNYGYSGPAATELGASTTPGLARVDVNRDRRGCHLVWRSSERAPSVVPKLSLANGLVYTYTKNPRPDFQDAWYFTALSFRTGHTIYKRLAGEGIGYNNNYAPVTLGPDGAAYVGVLGGITSFRDG